MSVPSSGGPGYSGGQSQVRPPGPAQTPPKPSFVLARVRFADVRRLREFGPPPGVELPATHAADKDPRYPSPTALRQVIGFAIDLVLHAGCGVAVGWAFANLPQLASQANNAFAAGLGTFLLLTIVHRIFLQWAFTTTLGKALVGLRTIRDDTGGRPTLWSLVKQWFVGIFAAFSALG